MDRPTILLTGADGQVGFELKRLLSASGEIVAPIAPRSISPTPTPSSRSCAGSSPR
jgi:dTDP-4-dehydrorhamnose reductase